MKNYNVKSGWSNDSDSNVNFSEEFEAKDLDDAVQYVKDNYINKALLKEIQEDGDDKSAILSYNYWTDEEGEDKTSEEFDEEKHTYFTEWFDIQEEEE